ncbi:hypothetical protein WJX73_005909 [Symbiochloris irregularis]|uniref:Rab-GAP TBC domain-containing protein n=1 Tax=Symbiochloris irregularis TaxID=706552 RepID=A0AAW1PVK6_9CHLO
MAETRTRLPSTRSGSDLSGSTRHQRDVSAPISTPARSDPLTRGPILRVSEGQPGAILCNDTESLDSLSRENSASKLEEADAVQQSPASSPCLDGFVDCAAALGKPATVPNGTHGQNGSMTEAASSTDLEAEDVDKESDDEDFSQVDGAGDTEVVYCREGVAMWPTPTERIMGRFSLINQHSVLFMAWLPYTPVCLNSDYSLPLPADADRAESNTARDRARYALRPTPLSDVKAIHKHTPAFGWQHIVIVPENGVNMPPLWFSTGGVRTLIDTLKQYAHLSKSPDNPNKYVVNDPTSDPLHRSLTSLELSDVLLGGPPPGASSTFAPSSGPVAAVLAAEGEGPSSARGPLVSQMLDGVQRVSQYARDTTTNFLAASALFGPPAGAEAGRAGTGSAAPSCPPGPQSSVPVPLARPGEASAAAQPDCMEEAGQPLALEAATGLGSFELIDGRGLERVAHPASRPRPPPLTSEEWSTFFTPEGRVSDEAGLRERIFHSGLDKGLRREAWKFLLGFHAFTATHAQRATLRTEKRAEYSRLKAQWTSITEAQAARFAKWRERRGRVDKDVRRTDREHPYFSTHPNFHAHLRALRRILLTYSIFNFDLGYCQGMSDLAAPILYVVRDEADAFWCFAALMERMQVNFQTDGNGMHAQLQALASLVQIVDPTLHCFLKERDCLNYYFCYRWLLIHFKREFPFEQVLRLWEAEWTGHLGPHLHIFLAAAVLLVHRRTIMEDPDMDLDGLLRFCIQLSGRMDLPSLLRHAEGLTTSSGARGTEAFRLAGLT